MEKSRAIELLEHLAWDRDIERNPYGDALNMAIEALKAQLSQEGTTKDTTSDLISRQAAIDALKEHRALYCDNTPETFSKLSYVEKSRVDELDTAIATLVNLPSAQPEPQWIPVGEKLPETEDFVLASLSGKYRNITFEHACEIADYADGEWCVYAYPHMSAEKCEELIEAWMPLPEPYTPNNE